MLPLYLYPPSSANQSYTVQMTDWPPDRQYNNRTPNLSPTFIAALVMFFLGSGPVKGFAVTLTIGLVTSVFTAIYLTRLMIVFWVEWRRPKELVL